MGYDPSAARDAGHPAAAASSTAAAASSASQAEGPAPGYYGPSSASNHPKGFMHPNFQRGGALYKTRLCRNYMAGHCSYSDHCTFAHGEAELRAHLHDQAAIEVGRWWWWVGECNMPAEPC